MRFNRRTDYGVMLAEALRPSFKSGEFVALSHIAKERRLPRAFLEKLADALRRKGYLEARRGAAGGYRLARDPKHITLRELIDVFEEPTMMRCMQSFHPEKQCPLVEVCSTRAAWVRIEERVDRVFRSVTLDTL